MKQAKKFLSLLLAFAMVMAMSLTAFAEETGPSITLKNNGRTYEIYQIFTGDLSEGILSNVKWGVNGTGYVKDKVTAVDSTILATLESLEGKSNIEILNAIEDKVDLTSTAYKTGSNTTISVPAGYYLVKDLDDADEEVTTYILQVVGNVTVNPKVGTPEVEKKIIDGMKNGDPILNEDGTPVVDENGNPTYVQVENKVDVNNAGIGDTVQYEIVGKVPANIADYTTYYYVFNDTLSKGLTYKNDIKITISGVDVTKYFYKNAEAVEGGTTQITVGTSDLIAFKNIEGVTIDKDTEIVIRYSATVNEDAIIAGTGNSNKVNLDYSNNPNDSGDGVPTDEPPGENPPEPTTDHPNGETPDDEVKTFVTEITITKVDQDGKILTGAEFTITGDFNKVKVTTTTEFVADEAGTYYKLANGTYTTEAPKSTVKDENGNVTFEGNEADYANDGKMYKKVTTTTTMGNVDPTATAVVGEVAADGTVTFTGLGAGHYTIEETKTPAGYNTIAPISFDVKATVNETALTCEFDKENVTEGQTISVSDNKLFITIENQKGTTLPETGGMGTRIFYLLGAVMVLCAGVLLVTKRRMAK